MSRLVTTILVLFLLTSVNTQKPYNATLARKLADLCSVAYCPEDTVCNWDCPPCKIWEDVKLLDIISQPRYSVFGFIARMEEGLVFVFEGTQDTEDVIIDLQFVTTVPYKDHPTARVHEGFWKAYSSVRDEIMMIAKNTDETLFCTGHSLGAAMATLLAVDIQETIGKRCIMYNMGSPRVGNREFVYLFERDSVNHRITHWNDPVPHLPPLVLGFYHTGDELWYNEKWDGYVYCEEPESKMCADSRIISMNVHDHRFYFNKSITACQ